MIPHIYVGSEEHSVIFPSSSVLLSGHLKSNRKFHYEISTTRTPALAGMKCGLDSHGPEAVSSMTRLPKGEILSHREKFIFLLLLAPLIGTSLLGMTAYLLIQNDYCFEILAKSETGQVGVRGNRPECQVAPSSQG